MHWTQSSPRHGSPFLHIPTSPTAMEGAVEPAPGPQAQRIGVYLRLRPVARPSGRIVASPQEGWVEFNVPKDATQG